MKILWNRDQMKWRCFHTVRRILISLCIGMRARNFLSWNFFFFKLPIASHGFSGVWTSYTRVTCLVSILGPSQRLRGWVWVRKPSSAFSLQMGFSKLTPIYFLKSMVSVGCLPHVREERLKETSLALTFFLPFIFLFFIFNLSHFVKHFVYPRAISLFSLGGRGETLT